MQAQKYKGYLLPETVVKTNGLTCTKQPCPPISITEKCKKCILFNHNKEVLTEWKQQILLQL